jgi:hypothetical protein
MGYRPAETLEQMVSRLSAGSYIPNSDPLPQCAPKGRKKESSMPKQIKSKEFVFKAPSQASKYDWLNWLNGDALVLTRGEDFAPPADSFTSAIKTAAAKRGQEVAIRILKAGDIDPTDPKGKATLAEGFEGIAMKATTQPDAAKAQAYKDHQKKLLADRAARGETVETPDDSETNTVETPMAAAG